MTLTISLIILGLAVLISLCLFRPHNHAITEQQPEAQLSEYRQAQIEYGCKEEAMHRQAWTGTQGWQQVNHAPRLLGYRSQSQLGDGEVIDVEAVDVPQLGKGS